MCLSDSRVSLYPNGDQDLEIGTSCPYLSGVGRSEGPGVDRQLTGTGASEVSFLVSGTLLSWPEPSGEVVKEVEGTGAHDGAGPSEVLAPSGHRGDRPNRAERRRAGKSDPLHAVEAARAVLGGTASRIPKTMEGVVEAIRALALAKPSACRARITSPTQTATWWSLRLASSIVVPEG